MARFSMVVALLVLALAACVSGHSGSHSAPMYGSQVTIAAYGVCGGVNWKGPTLCQAGTYCQVITKDYSECLPTPQTGPCQRWWGQCGGSLYKGPTCCSTGSVCQVQQTAYGPNAYYSQCIPLYEIPGYGSNGLVYGGYGGSPPTYSVKA